MFCVPSNYQVTFLAALVASCFCCMMLTATCVVATSVEQGARTTKDQYSSGAAEEAVLLQAATGGALSQNPSPSTNGRVNRLLAVPHSLARFMFYNSHPPIDRQSSSSSLVSDNSNSLVSSLTSNTAGDSSAGYKRSSSAFDPLTGMTIGKRSAPLMEFVNLEPVFQRHNLVRSPSRVYDMRWAPLDSLAESSAPPSSGQQFDYGHY